MVTVSDVLKNGTDILSAHDIENYKFESSCIFEKAFGVKYRTPAYDRIKNSELDEAVAEQFCELIRRRIDGEPLQYILGEWEFYGLPFKVGRGVLIPRQDTETLVDFLLDYFNNRENLRFADLCSGSGCIGITLEKKLKCDKAYCVELSDKAISYLKENIRLNGSACECVKGDVLLEQTAESFENLDFIACNPPYLTAGDMKNLQTEVQFEPKSALFGGEDGLDFFRCVTRIWKNSLKAGGVLAFEIGINQEEEVSQILIQHGFQNVRFMKDYCGVFRIVYGVKD